MRWIDHGPRPRWVGSVLCSLLVHLLFLALLVGVAVDRTTVPVPVDLRPPALELLLDERIAPSRDVDRISADPATSAVPGDGAGPADPAKACDTDEPAQAAAVATMAEWRGLVQRHLASYKHYPARALGAGLQGTSVVLITVCRNGRVRQTRIVQSSGIDLLDQESLQLVQRADPLPTLPQEHGAQSIDLILPVEFSAVR